MYYEIDFKGKENSVRIKIYKFKDKIRSNIIYSYRLIFLCFVSLYFIPIIYRNSRKNAPMFECYHKKEETIISNQLFFPAKRR